ncbi:hypothetical protein KG112_12145 [Nocardioides sp. zg-ZUI104]|uniref:hypothetical protein n=1 Tax=Nocardioides faecalis TaxID=2803858 RepID=UPI001BCD674A|nr:hypothetical protein [Nocardioides faecalis]MBS4753556.1 hypothetical protein [Nocardioides faecalis]
MTVAVPAAGLRARRDRGIVAGLVASFGALVAHVAGGGDVELVSGLVVLAVTVPLAVLLARHDTTDLPRLVAVALVAQVVGHLCLMMSSSPAGHAHLLPGPPDTDAAAGAGSAAGSVPAALPAALGIEPRLVALHLAVAAITVAVAAGLDRVLLGLVRVLVGRLLPVLPRVLAVPVHHRPRLLTRVHRRASQVAYRVLAARGPPRAARPATCAAH